MAGNNNLAKDSKRGDDWKLNTGNKYSFEFNPLPPVFILEIEDIHFHHNSSVIMPYYIADDEKEDKQRREQISGLAVLRACLLHAEKNKSRRLLITGHTDTTGSKDYNTKLSRLRADNVYYLLTGKKTEWLESVLKKNNAEDYQQILKWCSLIYGWRCDPGKIDNKPGKLTKQAAKTFQAGYNKEFNANIAVNGIVGKQTWGAFFDVLLSELALILETDEKGIGGLRSNLQMVDSSNPAVGCGEYYPIDQGQKDNYRSKHNRRVDLLFFESNQIPDLKCHTNSARCDYEACTVYKGRKPEYIRVEPCPQFLWIDLHTIDEFGKKFPRVSLQLKPQSGKTKLITTDKKGYWNGRVRADGNIEIYLSDGKTPVSFGASPQEKEEKTDRKTATINPKLAVTTTAEIVVTSSEITEDQKKSRLTIVKRYGRMPADSRKSKRSGNSGDREGEEAQKIHGRGFKPQKNDIEKHSKRHWGQFSADNLYIASGMDPKKLLSDLNQWLNGCNGTATSRGYMMYFIHEGKVLVFPSANLNKCWQFSIGSDWILRSPFGAYASYEYMGNLLLDMNSQCNFLVAVKKSQNKKEGQNENSTVSINKDKNEPISIYELLATAEQKSIYEKEVIPRLSGKVQLYYYYPSAGFGWFLARHGGTGLLENYPRNKDIRKGVNGRNRDVVKNCKNAYEVYIDSYIKKVKDIKFGPEAEKKLHALGPPEDQFKFPRPIGCTDSEWDKIIKAQASNHSFHAYLAVSNKLCDIYNVRGDGDVWLKFDIEVDSGELLGKIVDVKFKRNWETRDGRIKRVNDEITGSLKKGTGNVSVSVDPKTGESQQKVSFGVGNYGFEYNLTTGTAKASVYGIVSVEANPEIKRIGYGAQVSTRDLHKLYLKHVKNMKSKEIDKLANKVPALTLGFGIEFQLLRVATVMHYLMSTRGFFERRPISELKKLDWASLDLYEHAYLEELGWHEEIGKIKGLEAMLKYYPKNMIIWDAKRVLPYSHYPESAKNKWLDLKHSQKRASLNLIGPTLACEGNWRSFWKSLAPKTAGSSTKA